MATVEAARVPQDIPEIRRLFQEYATSLDVDLCFQGFKEELATLPGGYASLEGRLLVAWNDGKAVGCVALRRIDGQTAEMKRLYVQPEVRAMRLGRQLVERICTDARIAGYARICLDTLPTMQAAQALYRSMGFVPTAPYTFNPVPGTQFLALTL